jgi:hypothetical protein
MADKFADRFPPSVVATKLYERTSAKGNPYLTGRWGGLRVAVLKTQEQDSEGNAVWEMRFSSAPPSARPKAKESDASTSVRELTYTAVDPDDGSEKQPAQLVHRARSGFDRIVTEDEIPF